MGDDPTLVKAFLGCAVAGGKEMIVGTVEHKHRLLKRLKLLQKPVDPFETEIHANDAYQIPFFVS